MSEMQAPQTEAAPSEQDLEAALNQAAKQENIDPETGLAPESTPPPGSTEQTPSELPSSPAPTPQEQPKSQDPDSLRDYYASVFGDKSLSEKYRSDEELLAGLHEAYKKVGARDQEAEFGRWVRNNPGQALQHLQGGQKQEPAKEPEKTKLWPSAPEYQESWLYKVHRDGDGNLVANAGEDPALPQKITHAREWYDTKNREIAADPEKALGPILEKKAAEKAIVAANYIVDQRLSQQQAQNWVQSQANWMAKDGQNVVGSGLSEWGEAWAHHWNQAVQMGIPKWEAQAQYALNQVQAQATQAAIQQQAGTQAASKNPGPAQHRANTNIPPPAQTGELIRPKESLEAALMRRAQEADEQPY